MTDLNGRLRTLDRVDAPDLWPDISGREPRVVPHPPGWRRVAAALVAAAVAVAGIGFGIWMLTREARPRVSNVQPGPRVNGRIAFVGGESLLYVAIAEPGEIYIQQPGAPPHQLTHLGWSIHGLTWSPDGGRLAFVQSQGEGSDPMIYLINADGSDPRPLGVGVTPAWSPDGKMLAFARRSGDSYDIFVQDPDGGSATKLISCGNPCKGGLGHTSPAWSPDGKSIVFTGTDGLYVMGSDGSNLRRIRACSGTDRCFITASPAWSPDGSDIAYVLDHDPDYAIHVITTDGTADRTLFACREPQCLGIIVGPGPTWAPDGTKLAFTVGLPDQEVTRRVATINADGTGFELLDTPTSQSCCLTWESLPAPSPDVTFTPSPATSPGKVVPPLPG